MFTVCHILMSLDGKISGDFFGSEKTGISAAKYGELRNFYEPEAVLYGTRTMGEFLGYTEVSVAAGPVHREDNVILSDSYIVSVDRDAKIDYRSGTFERHGKKSQIIAVLSEEVSEERLLELKSKGIAYMFAGKADIDMKTVCDKLERLWGIRRLMIAGGGYIDWAFLKDDLIDELSLVIAPSCDGRTDTPALFCQDGNSGIVKEMKLKDVQTYGDTLWIRYIKET